MEKAAKERAEQEQQNATAQQKSKQERVAQLLEQGLGYDKKKEYARASAAYSEALRIDPDNMSIYFKQGWS